jgi:hypothetical protein
MNGGSEGEKSEAERLHVAQKVSGFWGDGTEDGREGEVEGWGPEGWPLNTGEDERFCMWYQTKLKVCITNDVLLWK